MYVYTHTYTILIRVLICIQAYTKELEWNNERMQQRQYMWNNILTYVEQYIEN